MSGVPIGSSSKVTGKESRSDGFHRVVELASRIVKEADVLLLEATLSGVRRRFSGSDFSKGVDFYAEVTRFETDLIKLALAQSHGNQSQAARLLGLKPTTLNAKIKQYGISNMSINSLSLTET